MYAHTHAHTHTRMRTHTYTHTRACTHTHTHTHMHTHTYTHAHTNTHTQWKKNSKLHGPPQVGFQHAVQVFLEGAGGEVAAPVVVVAVSVGEEVPGQGGEEGGRGPHLFMHSIEVVRQRPKLTLHTHKNHDTLQEGS